MGRPAKEVRVSSRVSFLLEKELNRKKLELHYYQRFHIILQASRGVKNKEIALFLGCDLKTIALWRKRWDFAPEVSDEFEKGEKGKGVSEKVLLEKIKSTLSDKPRPGHGSNLSDSDMLRLQALACEKPSDYGLPFSTWTHVELSKQAKRMGIEISPSWYGVILKKQITTP